jgi:hypothetical protein
MVLAINVLRRCFGVCRLCMSLACGVARRRCAEIINEELFAKVGVHHGPVAVIPVPILPIVVAAGHDVCLHLRTTRRGSNMYKMRTTCLDCRNLTVINIAD